MQITTVTKKSYVLSPENVRALKDVSLLLDKFVEDKELAEVIGSEACTSIGHAQDIIAAILNLDETEIALTCVEE